MFSLIGRIGQTIGRIGTATAMGGGGTAPDVVPSNAWRVPITAVYDSANNATVKANLLASSTAKTWPSFQMAGRTLRTVGWDVGAVAAPGAILYYSFAASGGTMTTMPKLEQSFDSTDFVDGTWTDITEAPVAPSGRANSGNYGNFCAAGQKMSIAAGAARKVRFSAQPASAVNLNVGLYQLQTDPLRNDATLILGNSITIGTFDPVLLRDYVVANYPGVDPIFFNLARGSATSQMVYDEQVVPLVPNFTFAKRAIWDGNINDITAYRPYASDTAAATRVGGGFDLNINALIAAEKTVYGVTCNFSNYPAGALAAQNGFVNLPVSTVPYNHGIISPKIKATLAATSWDSSVDAPLYDRNMSWAYNYETGLNPDGIHPLTNGFPVGFWSMLSMWDKIYQVATPVSMLDRLINLSPPWVETVRKQRLLDIHANLYPPTSDAAALAKRQTQIDKINALVTTYPDPVLTGSAVLPSTLTPTAGDFWFDSADWNTVTKSIDGWTSVWTDKFNAYTLEQLAATTSLVRPTRLEKYANNRGGLKFDGTDTMSSPSAPLIGALDAANQPFTLYFVGSAEALNLKCMFGWSAASSVDGLFFRNQTTRYDIGINYASGGVGITVTGVADITAGSVHVWCLTYDGTNVRWFRDGVQVGVTAAWSKPAFTGTTFRIGNKGPSNGANWIGGISEMLLQKTAHSDTLRTNLTDGLKQKWGIA